MASEAWCIISKHAAIRARQRGYCQNDIRFVIEHGTEVPEGYLLRRKDVRSIVEHNKLTSNVHVERAIRLVGTFVPITTDGRAASVYRPCSRKCKHLLHGRRSAGRPHGRRGRR